MPTNEETAVAARVLRERLPTLTARDMNVITTVFGGARHFGGFDRDDIENVVLTFFPDSEREDG